MTVAKKRKTREQKIILQLKRQLAQKNRGSEPRQEAIKTELKPKVIKKTSVKNRAESILSYHPSLIKKDLIKTLILTTLILSLEFMLYLRLR